MATAVLTAPLVTGAAIAAASLAPATAGASVRPTPAVRASLHLPLPTSVPSLPVPVPSHIRLPLPNPVRSLLPTPGRSPAPAPSPQPTGSAPGGPSPSPTGPAHTRRPAPKHTAGPGSHSRPAAVPPAVPPAASTAPGAPPPPNVVGYALPVPASLVTAHPALIGEGSPAPRRTRPAGPVTLAVGRGTPVHAVTAGTIRVIPASDGTSTIALSGTDGVTYTYKNVTAVPRSLARRDASAKSGKVRAGKVRAGKVRAGTPIGASGPGGLTFSISVPDAHGLVDADEAMQAWASGLSIDVRSLPDTIAPAATPARKQVLALTGPGAGPVASTLARALSGALSGTLSGALSGPLVGVRTGTLSPAALSPAAHGSAAHGSAAHGGATHGGATHGGKSSLARQLAAPGGRLTIAALANGTPAQAATLAGLLPAGHQLLWVAPPGTTPAQADAYRAIVSAHPGFRVESMPAALAPHQPTGELAAGTLTASYAATAYRLPVVSSQAVTALSWAERQLGKPYQWAASGPGSFDCSGLTMDALAQAGIDVPHNANAQWRQTRTHPVAEGRLAPGDLVFFAGSDGTRAAPGHVGIYAGDGEVIDAPHRGAPVRFDPLGSIRGYAGATDPYTPAATSGLGTSAAEMIASFGSLAVPSGLSQYQDFARQLSDSVWGTSQFPYLYLLWQRESGWNPAALNPKSGAFGIPQALPAGKMAASGPDWATDPYTQITWGIGYIRAAYGDPQAAWAHEVAFGWY